MGRRGGFWDGVGREVGGGEGDLEMQAGAGAGVVVTVGDSSDRASSPVFVIALEMTTRHSRSTDTETHMFAGDFFGWSGVAWRGIGFVIVGR